MQILEIIKNAHSILLGNIPPSATEAEYAFSLQKTIIPLLMQREYKPDGWLGMIKGTKLFFDFSGKYDFNKKLIELSRELGEKGKGLKADVVDVSLSWHHMGTYSEVLLLNH